jgi:hypothetical protein
MKEFVFFSMIIIPVYMFSALLDAFIFNSIQFWSGGNPVKANDAGGDGATRIVRLGGVTVTMVESDRGTTVTYERNGIVERRAIIETSATGYRLINETGALLAEAEMGQDGSVTLLDRDCQVVRQWTSINCWHWRERPSTEKNIDGSRLIGDRMDGLIERGEASPLAVIKAIQEPAVRHPLLAPVSRRGYKYFFLTRTFFFSYNPAIASYMQQGVIHLYKEERLCRRK